MIKKRNLTYILAGTAIVLTSNSINAHECGGVRGSQFKNPDGSKGGFVEITASINHENKSNIYIGSDVSICEYATVNSGKITGKATLTGDHVMNSGFVGGLAKLSSGTNNGATFLENSKQIGGVAESWQKFKGGYEYSGDNSVTDKGVSMIYNLFNSKREQEIFSAQNFSKEEIRLKQELGTLEQKIANQKQTNLTQKKSNDNDLRLLNQELESIKNQNNKYLIQIDYLETGLGFNKEKKKKERRKK